MRYIINFFLTILVILAIWYSILGLVNQYTLFNIVNYHTSYTLPHDYFDNIYKVTRINNPKSGGTAFLINYNNKKVLISNSHVCSLADENGQMRVLNSKLEFETPEAVLITTIIKRYQYSDLCMLTPVEGDGLALAQTSGTEPVTAVGYPYLGPLTGSTGDIRGYTAVILPWWFSTCEGPSFSTEMVQAPGGFYQVCLRTIVSGVLGLMVYPGNSGSPVLNKNNEVVGVIYASDTIDESALMVPLSVLREFINKPL